VRYPKPTKKAALFIPCVILVFLFVFLPKHASRWVAVIMLMLGLTYAVVGPMFVKGAELHQAHQEKKRSSMDGTGGLSTKPKRRPRRKRKNRRR
jgi:hypothetical protein